MIERYGRPAPKGKDDDAWHKWYDEYLLSATWNKRRARVFKRAGDTCECCGNARATVVHHISYRMVGREPLWDLRAVCRECHDVLHGKAQAKAGSNANSSADVGDADTREIRLVGDIKKDDPYLDSGHLICECGEGYLHYVAVLGTAEQYSQPDYDKNLYIQFYCENCLGPKVLMFVQHKGYTHLYWANVDFVKSQGIKIASEWRYDGEGGPL